VTTFVSRRRIPIRPKRCAPSCCHSRRFIGPAQDVADVEETGDTLEENALLKARALVEATGRAAIADDTGSSSMP